MNIDPNAIILLQGKSTPPRKNVRKQDDITPTPPRTTESQQAEKSTTTKRAQGHPKRSYKAASINAMDIARYFTCKAAHGQDPASVAASASSASTTLPATTNTENSVATLTDVAKTTSTIAAATTTETGIITTAGDSTTPLMSSIESTDAEKIITTLAATTVEENPINTLTSILLSEETRADLEGSTIGPVTTIMTTAESEKLKANPSATSTAEITNTTPATITDALLSAEENSDRIIMAHVSGIDASDSALKSTPDGTTEKRSGTPSIIADSSKWKVGTTALRNATAGTTTVITTPSTNRKDAPDPLAMEITQPPSIKLVPAGKTPYKRKQNKTPAKVLFSPTNEVRVVDQDIQVTCASVVAKDAPPTPAATPVHHKHKTVFEISVKINPNTEHVNMELRNQLLHMLSFIREWIDPDAAFLPKRSSSSLKPIVDKPSFPAVTYLLVSSYFYFTSPSWYTATKERNKMVRLSAIMGLNVDPAEIELAKADINGFGVILTIKPHQEVETSSKLIFLGAPYAMSKHYAKQMMIKVFKAVEDEIKRDQDYDQELFAGVLPDFAVIITQPQNMYVEQAKGEKYVMPAKERRAIHIMCASRDYDRLATLTMMAKGMDMWRPVFGLCYPTTTPDVNSEDDASARYIRMVECHQSAQMCQDSFAISGLLRLDEAYTLSKDDGSTATVSARKVLSLIELYDPEQDAFCKVFICAIQKDDKKFHAYYPGGHPLYRAYVAEFKLCPAAQIYFYLIKRKFLTKDVMMFIRKIFNVDQQSTISKAKYNNRTRLAYLQSANGSMDIVDAVMASGSAIDPYRGLPESRIKALQEENYKGPELGAPDYFDFDEGQSVTTVQNKSSRYARKQRADEVDIDLRSVYDVAGSVAGSMAGEGMEEECDLGDSDDEGEERSGEDMTMDLSLLTGDSSDVTQPKEVAVSDATPAIQGIAKTLRDLDTTTETNPEEIGIYDDEAEIEAQGSTFASELEKITTVYKEMIAIIDALMSEFEETNAERDVTDMLLEPHPMITDVLRNQLNQDTDGSPEMIKDYLTTMKTGILHAQDIETHVPLVEVDHTEEEMVFDQMDVEVATDPSTKPQGCDTVGASLTDRTETAIVTVEDTEDAARLGAEEK